VTDVPPNTPPIGIPGDEVPPDRLRHVLVTPVWNAQGTAVYVPAFVLYQALSDFFIWERADATHGGSVFVSELPAVGMAVASPDRRAVIFATYSPSGRSNLLARSLDPGVPDSTYAWAAPHADAAVEQFGLPTWSPQTDAVAMFRCRATCDVVVLTAAQAEPQVVVTGVPGQPGMSVAWGRAD